MISISIFRINAENRTIWYNLIQTSLPLVYTNYFYNNIYCPNMGGSRGGDRGSGHPPPPPPPWNCQIICFWHVEIFRQTPSGNLDPLSPPPTPPHPPPTPPPPTPTPRENFLDPGMPNTIFQNLFFQNNYFPDTLFNWMSLLVLDQESKVNGNTIIYCI